MWSGRVFRGSALAGLDFHGCYLPRRLWPKENAGETFRGQSPAHDRLVIERMYECCQWGEVVGVWAASEGSVVGLCE